MDIGRLREFIVFSKHLNFSSAAKELHLSQPSLSVHISDLEKELGFDLVDRQSAHISLTYAGSVFIDGIQDVLMKYDGCLEECRKVSSELAPIRIGFINAPREFYSRIAKLKNASFSLIDTKSNVDSLRLLQMDSIDIALFDESLLFGITKEELRTSGIKWVPWNMSKMKIYMMKTHPLAQNKALSRHDLVNAVVVINQGACYDNWKELVQKVVGTDIPLTFKLNQLKSFNSLFCIDFGESIHICKDEFIDPYLCNRDDIVAFDELDGEPLLFADILAYKTSNLRVDALVKVFEEGIRALQ